MHLMKYVLLVLTQADLDAMPKAVAWFSEKRAEALWIIHSPHLGLDTKPILDAAEAEINKLEDLQLEAIKVQDFSRAQELKNSIAAVRMERDRSLLNAFRAIEPTIRQKSYDRMFKPFFPDAGGFGRLAEAVDITTLPDIYERDQIPELLMRLKGSWQEYFNYGTINIVSPDAFPAPSNGHAPPPPPQDIPAREARELELRKGRYMGIKKVATGYGLPVEGKGFDELLESILVYEKL